MDPGRLPPNRGDPKGRNVWDPTYNHEAAGSDVWLKLVPSFSSDQACRPLNPWYLPNQEPKKARVAPHDLVLSRISQHLILMDTVA